MDELVEAREDSIIVIHPLTDDRRVLPVDKTGELIAAAPGFQLVASYNPGYQHAIKDLKPSTRQRFVALDFDFPEAAVEARIVAHETGVKQSVASALVETAHRVRRLRDQGLAEGPGTRLLVSAGRLISEGIGARQACQVAIAAALTDDPDLLAAITDIIDTTM
jgi:nitric oxide reductase NorQ protein